MLSDFDREVKNEDILDAECTVWFCYGVTLLYLYTGLVPQLANVRNPPRSRLSIAVHKERQADPTIILPKAGNETRYHRHDR